MANLTDTELRKRLQSYNVDVGPISQCTRYLWERKLLKLEKLRKSLHSSLAVSNSESDAVLKSPSCGRRKPSHVPKCESLETPMDIASNSSEECLSSPDDYELIPDDEPGSTPFPGSVRRRSVHKKSLPKTPKNCFPLKRSKRCVSSETPEPSVVAKCRRKPGRPPKLRNLSGKRFGDSFEELIEDSAYFSASESSKGSKKRRWKFILKCLIYVLKGVALVLITAVLVLIMAQSWSAQIENLSQAPLNAEPPQVSE